MVWLQSAQKTVHVFTLPKLALSEDGNEQDWWNQINAPLDKGDGADTPTDSQWFEVNDTQHKDWVHGISFADELTYMTVSGGADRRVFKYKAQNHARIREDTLDQPRHTEGVMGICHSPDGKHYITVSIDKTAKVFAAEDNSLVRELHTGDAPCYDVAYHPDGTMVSTLRSITHPCRYRVTILAGLLCYLRACMYSSRLCLGMARALRGALRRAISARPSNWWSRAAPGVLRTVRAGGSSSWSPTAAS